MRHIIKHRVTYSIILLSALAFVLIYGINVLDVTYTDWLLIGGDLSQHYLGWKFFRIADWQWYIGMMNNIAYPYSESVIFTDSIPLFAVLFKLLSGVLPKSFQYFGIWGLLCFVLQGFLTSLILRKYINGSLLCDLQVIIGSLFFVLAPILLRRMYWHTSLAGQWIILLAICFYVYHDEWFGEWGRAALCWGLLGVLCAMTHIYFIPMCGVVLLGFVTFDGLQYKKVGRMLAPVTAFCISAFCCIWLLGGLYSGMDDGAPGLGYYSFNLDGFVSGQEWSALLPDLRNYADGQYEGFAYLGFGMIILLIIVMITAAAYMTRERLYLWKNLRRFCSRHRSMIICIFMASLSVVMAASHEVSFGSRLLFRIPILYWFEEIWAVFRASGRLIWPAVYLLMVFILCAAAKGLTYLGRDAGVHGHDRRWLQGVTLSLFVLCLAFQVYDLNHQLQNKHQEFAQRREYQSELKSSFWNQVAETHRIRHIVFADKDNMKQEQLYSFADYASEHDMTINDFYFARALTYPIGAVAEDFMKHPNQNTLYVFTEEAVEQSKAYDFTYYEEDEFLIGVTDAFSF